MKTRIFITLKFLFLFGTSAHAQWNNSITVNPPNPTTTDTLYIYADCSFPSGSCNEHTQTLYISPGYIYAQATHCLGMLTVICNSIDTFKIIPLAAGNYKFLFNVNIGSLPSPCTPGIAPGPTDSISFTVTDASSVPDYETQLPFRIFPNPVKEKLHLICDEVSLLNKNVSFFIYSLTEQQLLKYEITNKEMLIDISMLPAGFYFCHLAGNDFISAKQLMEVMK